MFNSNNGKTIHQFIFNIFYGSGVLTDVHFALDKLDLNQAELGLSFLSSCFQKVLLLSVN